MTKVKGDGCHAAILIIAGKGKLHLQLLVLLFFRGARSKSIDLLECFPFLPRLTLLDRVIEHAELAQDMVDSDLLMQLLVILRHKTLLRARLQAAAQKTRG